MEEEAEKKNPKKRFALLPNPILNIFFAICFIGIALYYLLSAPLANPSILNREGILIHVAPGESIGRITNELEAKKIVRNATLLKVFIKLFDFGHGVPKGDYLFIERAPVYKVAWMLARGIHGVDPVRVTIKEGATNDAISNLLADKLSGFRKDEFLSDSRAKQGYLFPDTYFFFSFATTDEILSELSLNFTTRVKLYKTDIEKSNHTEEEIITMASLIQKEAAGESDAGIVSGILWKRFESGMLLQADADRSTYTTKGLPPRPIGNPGLLSIKAAIHPEDSPYLYYLHDKNGIIHLARTYTEHKRNIANYLK